MFWLKKFVSFWLMPLPFCLTLLTVGLVILLFSRRARLGRWLLIAGTVLLGLFSNKVVSTWLVQPIELTFARSSRPTLPYRRSWRGAGLS
jgi:formate hydrogenlyase subunit 3/multisubunit Na+/H+ antiporter MnhD subunit